MKYSIQQTQILNLNYLNFKLKSTLSFYGLLSIIFMSLLRTPLNSKGKFLVGIKGHGAICTNRYSKNISTSSVVDGVPNFVLDGGAKLFGGIAMEYKSDSWYALYTGIMYDYTYFATRSEIYLSKPDMPQLLQEKRHGVAIPLNLRFYPGSKRQFCFFGGTRFLIHVRKNLVKERFMLCPSFGIDYQFKNGLTLGTHNLGISLGYNFV